MSRQAFWKPDVVMVIAPSLMCAPAAWLAARLSGARCWLHIQDFEVDAAFDMGILPQGRMRNIVLGMERVLMRAFDRVSTISSNMLTRLGDKDVDPARVLLFPNWANIDTIFPLTRSGPLRDELGIPSTAIVALYSGNMGEKQGLEIVLDAARSLIGHAQIHFVMCGDGVVRQRLMQTYSGLPNVSWKPLQPLDRLNELLNMADIHLLPQREDVADLVMPSKLTGMLASGRPVVATAHAGTALAQVVAGCGLVVAPENPEAFANAIATLAANPSQRDSLGRAARSYAENNLSRDAILGAFERELIKLCGADRLQSPVDAK